LTSHALIYFTAVTRTVITLYLVPLLSIHTTSQLTLLARLHHLRNLSELNSRETTMVDDRTTGSPRDSVFQKAAGQVGQLLTPWSYFSLGSMGLDEFVDKHSGGSAQQGLVSSLWSVGSSTASYLFGSGSKPSTAAMGEPKVKQALHLKLDLETERAFLCFSWWLLHVGWKELEERVRVAVKQVFKPWVFPRMVETARTVDMLLMIVLCSTTGLR
jgi:hypothetical protein